MSKKNTTFHKDSLLFAQEVYEIVAQIPAGKVFTLSAKFPACRDSAEKYSARSSFTYVASSEFARTDSPGVGGTAGVAGSGRRGLQK